MCFCTIKPSWPELWTPALLETAAASTDSQRCAFSRSQGHLAVPALWPWHPKMLCPLLWPSPSLLMLTSKELIPQSESHMMPCCSKVLTLIGTHAHICPYLNLIHNCGVMSSSVSFAVLQWSLAWCTLQSVERYRRPALRVECFAWVRHHSFRVDNLHEVDYSLGQRKRTGFYWLTAAKWLLCRGLIFRDYQMEHFRSNAPFQK